LRPGRVSARQMIYGRADLPIALLKTKERPMNTTHVRHAISAALVPFVMLGATAALADVGHSVSVDIGQAGDVSHIDRVIEVDLGEMYFDPFSYNVERGETVRFVLNNSGRVVHEFAIGTEEMQNIHAGEMRALMSEGMMTTRVLRHDRMIEAGRMHLDANSRLLEPRESTELVWTFSGDQDELIIACNVPGHRAAGMEAPVAIGADHAS
jgi:uncharacterized cupredoxin-like copper-binding protein